MGDKANSSGQPPASAANDLADDTGQGRLCLHKRKQIEQLNI